jgi:hypothetical protein
VAASGTATNFSNTTPFTVSMWEIASTTVAEVSTASPSGAGWILYDVAGTPYFGVVNGVGVGIQVGTTSPSGAPNPKNVCAVYDGTGVISGLHIYINGVAQTTGTVLNTLSGSIAGGNPVIIGALTTGVEGNVNVFANNTTSCANIYAQGPNKVFGSGGTTSVTQIVAGTGVTISPTNGIGAVTVTASGGGGGVTGSGTTGYIPKFTGSTAVGNSSLDDGVTTAGVLTTPEPITTNGGSVNIGTTVSGGNAGFSLTPNGADQWDVVATGSGAPPNTVSVFNATANKTPLAIFSHGGVSSVGTYSAGVFGWNADASYASGTLDTGFSRDSAGSIDVGNGTAGNSSGTIKAATGTFGAALTVAGNNVCQSTGTNCPSTTDLPWYANIQGSLFTTVTMRGPVYKATTAETVSGMVMRQTGTISCSVAPSAVVMDLATSPATAYGGATATGLVVSGGVTDGVYTFGGSPQVLTSGHFYGVAFTDGTCVTAPTFDITMF